MQEAEWMQFTTDTSKTALSNGYSTFNKRIP